MLSSDQVQNNFKPLQSLGTCQGLTFKQLGCKVLNMSYFDIFEQIGLVNEHDGSLRGCMDEWVDGL